MGRLGLRTLDIAVCHGLSVRAGGLIQLQESNEALRHPEAR